MQKIQPNPTINGTVEECLRHYFQSIPNTQLARMAITNATTGKYNTIRSWATKGVIPQGENLVKLRYFLQNEGYKLTNPDLPSEIQNLITLVGESLITFRDVATLLEVDDRRVRDLFLGNNLNQNLLKKIRDTNDAYKNDLLRTKEERRRSKEVEMQSSTQNVAEVRQNQIIQKQQTDNRFLETAAHWIASINPMLDSLLTNTTSEDRKQLREILTRNGVSIFDISNKCNALCSEEAFHITQNQNKKRRAGGR